MRGLKDSIQDEPDWTWNKEMHALLREMSHYRNSLEPGAECSPEAVSGFEDRYRRILEKAKGEYEYIPVGEYYKKGCNLYVRLWEYMHNHLLFLHDPKGTLYQQ